MFAMWDCWGYRAMGHVIVFAVEVCLLLELGSKHACILGLCAQTVENYWIIS